MYPGVAIRASCIECLGPVNASCVNPVALMALQAQKGFPCIKEFIVNRTMGAVTVKAVFHDVSMFEKKGASLVGVALDTGLFYTVLQKIFSGKTAMGVVTVDAEDPPLLEGMMTGQEKLCLGRRMAGETQFTRCERSHFQIRT